MQSSDVGATAISRDTERIIFSVKHGTFKVIDPFILYYLLNYLSIYVVVLLIPVTSAGVERANSALKFVKTVHRHTMSQDRFNALVLLFVHRDIALDYNKIINMFANRHPRRMLLLDPLMGESS